MPLWAKEPHLRQLRRDPHQRGKILSSHYPPMPMHADVWGWSPLLLRHPTCQVLAFGVFPPRLILALGRPGDIASGGMGNSRHEEEKELYWYLSTLAAGTRPCQTAEEWAESENTGTTKSETPPPPASPVFNPVGSTRDLEPSTLSKSKMAKCFKEAQLPLPLHVSFSPWFLISYLPVFVLQQMTMTCPWRRAWLSP